MNVNSTVSSPKLNPRPRALTHAVSAGVSGALNVGLLLPFFTLAAIQKQTGNSLPAVITTVRCSTSTQTMRTLYKGLPWAVPTVVVSRALTFGINESILPRVRENISEPYVNFISAITSTTLKNSIVIPMDNIKTMRQLDTTLKLMHIPKAHTLSSIELIRSILHRYGPLGLYKGSLPAFGKSIVSSTAWLTAYQESKSRGYSATISGAIAGLSATVTSYPLALFRTVKVGSIGHCPVTILNQGIREQGVQRIFRGLPISMLNMIGGSITFSIMYDFFLNLAPHTQSEID